jgi:hypothetical protein
MLLKLSVIFGIQKLATFRQFSIQLEQAVILRNPSCNSSSYNAAFSMYMPYQATPYRDYSKLEKSVVGCLYSTANPSTAAVLAW